MRLLLVEDDRGSAGFLRSGLEAEHYQLEIATDGQAALERGLSGNFDLILLDVMLPGKNGLEVLREWRQRDMQSPILMLSGMNSVEDTVKGLELGADDYLRKPFAFEELVARIRALLRRGTDLELDPTL